MLNRHSLNHLAICLLVAVPCSAQTFPAFGGGGVPDNEPGSPLVIPVSVFFVTGGVSTVSLEVEMTHTWIGDLEMVLTAPNGESHTILSRVGDAQGDCCGDGSNLNGVYTFDDTQTGDIWAEAAAQFAGSDITQGGYRTTGNASAAPTDMNASFACANPNGQWLLSFADFAGGDIGTVSAVSITLTAGNGLFTTTGTGCPATFLSISGRPCIGETVLIDANNLPANTGAATMFIGANTGGLDLTAFGSPGCLLFVTPFFDVLMGVVGNTATFTFPILNDPGIAGLSIDGQAIMLGTPADTGTTFGLITSDAFALTIGS